MLYWDLFALHVPKNQSKGKRVPHSTLSMKTVTVRPKKKGGAGCLEDIGGVPLHVHIGQFVTQLENNKILDEKNKRYFTVEKVVPRGRSITIIGEAGYYGEGGNTYSVITGKRTHKRGEDEASTSAVRTTLFVPPMADMAVFAVESRRGVPNGGIFIDAFLKHMRARYTTLFFPSDTVLENDAWSTAGNLKEIKVVRNKQPLDLSSGIDPNRAKELVLGNLIVTGAPPEGMKFWPKKIWDLLRTDKLDAAVFLRARAEGTDPDENVYVTIERDSRQKTFELGSDGKPSIREVLTTNGQALLDDHKFFMRASDSVSGVYFDLQKGWDTNWFAGEWPDIWTDFKWTSLEEEDHEELALWNS